MSTILDEILKIKPKSVLDINGTMHKHLDQLGIWSQAVEFKGELIALGRGFDMVIVPDIVATDVLVNMAMLASREYVVAPQRHVHAFKQFGFAPIWRNGVVLMQKIVFKSNSTAWWNEKGQKYDLKGDRRERPEEYELAAKRVETPVLEVGSAFGRFLKYLGPGVCYMGIEISEYMVRRSRKLVDDGLFVQGDFLQMGSEWHGAFNTIVASQVLEHFPSVVPFLEQVRRLARKNFVFDVPRGLPSEAVKNNDGHINGWANEEALIKDMKSFGDIEFWEGESHHICGELSWV